MAVDEMHMDAVALTRSPDTREAFGFLAREAVAERSRRLAHWFATATDWPQDWQRAATEMDGSCSPSTRRRPAPSPTT